MLITMRHPILFFFFFNDTATTEIYTLSLHDALPILMAKNRADRSGTARPPRAFLIRYPREDRKSTRLNSSHLVISYAVFCLKKKKTDKCGARSHGNATRYFRSRGDSSTALCCDWTAR